MKKNKNQLRKNNNEDKSFEEVVPQLKEEKTKHYLAFKVYCQEGSLVKTHEKIMSLYKQGKCPKDLVTTWNKPPTLVTLERWCKQFNWVKRKEAWSKERSQKTAKLMSSEEYSQQIKKFLKELADKKKDKRGKK